MLINDFCVSMLQCMYVSFSYSKVCEFRQPSELKEMLSSYLPIKEKPTSNSELLEACGDVIKYSVKTSKC